MTTTVDNPTLLLKKQQKIIHQLTQQIEYLKNIITNLPGHVYWLDRNNTYQGCNFLQAKDAGFQSPKKIVGKKNKDMPWKDVADFLNENNNAVMKSGKTKIIEESGPMSDGTNKMFLSHKVPLKNKQGNVIGILGISFDITDRKQMEKEIRIAKEKLEMAEQSKLEYLAKINETLTGQPIAHNKSVEEYADNLYRYLDRIITLLPAVVSWADKNGVYLGCNKEQVKCAGLSSQKDIIGKTIFDLLPFDQANVIHKNNLDIMTSGKPKTVEELCMKANGEIAIYLSNKTPLRDENNNLIGLLSVSLDITHHKKMVDELQKVREFAEIANQAKTKFLYNMYHDIRTPFSGILGFAQLLHDKENDPKKKEELSYIIESAQKLLDYFNEILEFVKIESKQTPLSFKKFNIKQLLNEITDMMIPAIKHKTLKLHIDFDSNIPSLLISDRTRIHRILVNLISNAIKFTEKGQINIDVKLLEKNEDEGILKIIVKDTGIGIPEDQQKTIFKKFSRLTSSHTSIYAGIGLGLHVVKHFIKDLNGQIEVKSQTGKGSQFICTLPFHVPSLEDNNEE